MAGSNISGESIGGIRHIPILGAAAYTAWPCRHVGHLGREGRRFWVKFHFRTKQGIQNLMDAEAEAMVGNDRETHQRDLFESIERSEFPRWTLFIQVMTEQDRALPFNPFDLTKVWPKADFPLMEVGYSN